MVNWQATGKGYSFNLVNIRKINKPRKAEKARQIKQEKPENKGKALPNK